MKKVKKYVLRFASEEERKFMFNIFKKYVEDGCEFKVTEWSVGTGYTELQNKYCMNIKANGLIDWAGKPHPDNFGVCYVITKNELKKWMAKNSIIKPKFEEGKIIYR